MSKKQNGKNVKNKKIKILLLLTGMTGFILFFPVRIQTNNSCIGEKLSLFTNNRITLNEAHCQLPQHYIVPYGILWWFSIVVTFWNIKLLTQNKKVKKNENPEESDF